MAAGSKILDQVVNAYNGLKTIQKSMVIAILGVLFIFLIAMVVWSNQERMALLATDLNSSDANAVVEELKRLKVKHEIGSDNSSIYVPEKQVGRLKFAVFGGNVALSGDKVSWSKLETPSLTSTDFSQKNTYWRTLEEELAKNMRDAFPTIITKAVVKISPPNESVFIQDKEPAKASVSLHLRSPKVPNAEAIQSIMNVVAYSVQGLKPDDVSVIDQFLRNLSSKREEPPGVITEAQKLLQRDEEDRLAAKVRDLLEVPVGGRDRVRVTTTVELDFDKTQIKEHTFDPQSQVERSVHQGKEDVVKRQGPLGVPGTPSNVAPADPGLGDRDVVESAKREESITNYEISSKMMTVEKNPGNIKRVNISVMLDYKDTYPMNLKGEYEKKREPYTQEEIDKFNSLVASGVGIDTARGDSVSVHCIEFAPKVSPLDEANARRQYWLNVGKFLAPFVLLFLTACVWMLYKLLSKPKELPQEEVVQLLQEQTEAEEVEGEEGEKVVAQPKTLAEIKQEIQDQLNADASAAATPESQRREVIKERIIEIIATDPENAASMVRTWLTDDEGK